VMFQRCLGSRTQCRLQGVFLHCLMRRDRKAMDSACVPRDKTGRSFPNDRCSQRRSFAEPGPRNRRYRDCGAVLLAAGVCAAFIKTVFLSMMMVRIGSHAPVRQLGH
jgi:hypothetical protein